jgi:hypothetical protein
LNKHILDARRYTGTLTRKNNHCNNYGISLGKEIGKEKGLAETSPGKGEAEDG